MSNHISCATLRNKFFLLYYWLVVLIPLLVKIQGTCQYCWCIPQCSQNQQGDRLFVYMPEWCSSRKPSPVSNSGCWCWYHKDCSLYQVMEASAEILPCQQMHYQMLLGLITPVCMLLAGIPVLSATLTLEGVWRLTAQMSLVAFYLPNCWLYTGSRSNCGKTQGLWVWGCQETLKFLHVQAQSNSSQTGWTQVANNSCVKAWEVLSCETPCCINS